MRCNRRTKQYVCRREGFAGAPGTGEWTMMLARWLYIGIVFGFIAVIIPSTAWADEVTRACAASPYKVGDKLTRLGPPGDSIYNSLVVKRIYVLLGPRHPSDCVAVPSWCAKHPTPLYMQSIEGWLYYTDGTTGNYGIGQISAYNFLQRGIEMDTTLNFVDGPIATVVIRNSHPCSLKPPR